MCTFVYYQIGFACETFIIIVALIWFISSMCSLVVLSDTFSQQKIFYNQGIDMVSHQYVFSGVLLGLLSVQHYYEFFIDMV